MHVGRTCELAHNSMSAVATVGAHMWASNYLCTSLHWLIFRILISVVTQSLTDRNSIQIRGVEALRGRFTTPMVLTKQCSLGFVNSVGTVNATLWQRSSTEEGGLRSACSDMLGAEHQGEKRAEKQTRGMFCMRVTQLGHF